MVKESGTECFLCSGCYVGITNAKSFGGKTKQDSSLWIHSAPIALYPYDLFSFSFFLTY